MKPLIIYHANCADGFGAAYAAWKKYGDNAEYFPCSYGDVKSVKELDKLPNLCKRHVYVLDFSFPLDVMETIADIANSMTWLDHHKTAFEMWCDSDTHSNGERDYYEYTYDGLKIILDNSRSGAMIAWDYFHNGSLPNSLIKHIDDYDRWQFKLTGTKEINKALWLELPWSFEQWEAWDDTETLEVLREVGSKLLQDHNNRVESGVKFGTIPCAISTREYTYYGFSLNCPPNVTSDSGHVLATKGGTYGLLWHMDSRGKAKCSLRSNGEYDVSAIAKLFGGGGHKNAAGFEVDMPTLLSWLRPKE